jgi:predicted dehydrogenase
MTQKLKMGMVGGGRDAFIGAVHRMAARLDGRIELVAGAFSSDPAKSRASGEDLGLHPSRVYSDYDTMAAAESKLPAGERIDFVSIVTPNHVHFPPAKTFLEAGFHVVCESVARPGKVNGQSVCVDSQLYGVSDGQRSAGAGPER